VVSPLRLPPTMRTDVLASMFDPPYWFSRIKYQGDWSN
jgi:hypothetical protein